MKLVELLRQYAGLSSTLETDGSSDRQPDNLEQLKKEQHDESDSSLSNDPAGQPDDLREAYKERVAIIEIDGELSRDEAEKQARKLITGEEN